MKGKLTALCSSFFLVAALVFSSAALPTDADAARIGGGRSFGSQPSMSQPAARPNVQQSRQQATQQQPAAAAQSKPGFLGGLGGGLLGGLLAGSLIGSLLGGGGFGGGGFLDILLLGLIAFLIYRFVRARRAAQSEAQATPQGGSYNDFQNNGYQQQDFNTMQRNDMQPQGSAWDSLSSQQQGSMGGSVIQLANFNEEEFLRGAKMAYNKLQDAWSRRALDEIAVFSTPEFLAHIKEQAKEDPNPMPTQILVVNASVISASEFGNLDRVEVYFDVMMREDPRQTTPISAREIWHFVRTHDTGSWLLDGITQTA